MSPTFRIPLARPVIGSLEETFVLEALRSGWVSSRGPFVDRLERELARCCEADAAVVTANGTVALHLAVLALGLQPGDEVVVPALTYVATANAVRYACAQPVLVDVSPDTWTLDPHGIEAVVSPKTRGIIAVHLYGHPADMGPIIAVARRRNLWVVEDAAEALGARYHGRTVGSLGDAATFSFYGNKLITSGEGGAVTCNDAAVAERLRLLRNQGVTAGRNYWHSVIGYNYRLTNVAAALAAAQLSQLSKFVARRRSIIARYERNLMEVPGIAPQPRQPWAVTSPWMTSFTMDESVRTDTRDRLLAHLSNRGIETRPFFTPIHNLPPYRHLALEGEMPVAEGLGLRGFNLPTYFDLRDHEIDEICEHIRRFFDGGRGE